ncbi:MAG: radical SAM protein [Acidobacteria bacterium]|nr:radical SAM protein [Acidobacteriota bacterium]
MVEFDSVALLKANQPIPALMSYGINDLVEVAGLAAAVRELVGDLAIPVGPCDREPLAGFATFARKHQPALVGISTDTCGVSSALAYAEIAKRHGAFVVLGGHHPSALPEQVLASLHVDAVVRGEGEQTLAELVAQGPSERVLGLSYKDGSRIVHNPERPLIEDLDSLPFPLRQLRPPRFGLAGSHYHTDTVYTSRGCKARCAFCANHLVGKRWRQRSIENVVRELASIPPGRQRKPKMVKLWDPNFMNDPERVAELCERIVEADLNRRFRFVAETRVEDIVRGKEVLPLMKRAGFCQLGSGLESPNQATLELHRKGVRVAWIEEASQLLATNDIHFCKFFIIGHPNEGIDDILHYPGFAAAPGYRRQSSYFFALTPYPGTAIHEEYHRKGLIASYNWNLYTNYCAVVEPPGIPRQTLQALLGTVMAQTMLNKQWARGEPLRVLVGKTLALLLANARVLLLDDTVGSGEAEDNFWQSLSMLKSTPPRPAPTRRRVLPGLKAVRFHHRRRPPIAVRVATSDGLEQLVTEHGASLDLPRLGTLNLDIGVLLALARTLDPRHDGHDVMTLLFAPRRMHPLWMASLLWQATKVAGILAALGLAHLRRLR